MTKEVQSVTTSNIYDNKLLVQIEEKALDVVHQMKQLSLINASDISGLEAAQAFILSTYTDVPEYRPMPIKLAGVLNDAQFPTPDAKFWQCKKEAEVHFNELVHDFFKLRRSAIDIAELEHQIKSMQFAIDDPDNKVDKRSIEFNIQRSVIKREEYLFNTKKLEKEIKYRIAEVVEWAAISDHLSKTCSYSTRSYGEHVTPSLIAQLEIKIKELSKQVPQNTSVLRIAEAQLKAAKELIGQK